MGANHAPFRLLDLAPEIFAQVCDYLDDTSLITLRTTCHTALKKSLFTFGKRFFQHIFVILHPDSLSEFADIVSREHLAKHVRKVSVCITLSSLHGRSKAEKYNWGVRTRIYRMYRTGKLPKIKMDDTNINLAHSLLRDSLSKLGKLEVIEVDDLPLLPLPNDYAFYTVYCGSQYVLPAEPATIRFQRFERVLQTVGGIMRSHTHLHLRLPVDLFPESVLRKLEDEVPLWLHFMERTLVSLTVQSTEPNQTSWANILLKGPRLEEVLFHGRKHLVWNPLATLFYTSLAKNQQRMQWPNIRRISFEEVALENESIDRFLLSHKGSVENVQIKSCQTINEDWKPVFVTLQSLPRLQVVSLSDLWNDDPESPSHKSPFERFDDYLPTESPSITELHGNFVQEGLKLLVNDYFEEEAFFLHGFESVVDMRKVNALIEGLVAWDGKDWVDTPKMLELKTRRSH